MEENILEYEERRSLADSVTTKTKNRGVWQGQFESALALIGNSVGLGNIWRFPYLCYKNGGGAFIIPFLLFNVVCGLPLLYMELCLGQFSGKSPIHVWTISPLFRGIGVVMVIVSALYCWYYGMIIGWVYYYLIQSFYPTLGWSTCNNTWNTAKCIEIFKMNGIDDAMYDGPEFVNSTIVDIVSNGRKFNSSTVNVRINKTNTAATEFWENNVLGLSSGIDDMGRFQWHLVGSLVIGWAVVFLCLAKGVKTLGKVVYVTVLAPYILLTVLLIRGITLDGSWDGLKLYLYPDFSKLSDPQIWRDAAVQVFYSLGPAWGGVITMASFNKFHHNVLRDAFIVSSADAFTAIFAGLPVFAVLGYMSKETGKPIDYFKSSGPGLVFIAYPEALTRLPLPQFWSVLFFFTLVFVGVDTMFTVFETVSTTIIDLYFSKLHKYKVAIVGALITFICVMSLPLTMSGGFYLLLLMDCYIGTFNVVITALIEVIVVAWIYGADRFSSDIELMIGRRPSFIVRIVWVVCVPLFVGTINFMTFLSYSAPYYGKDGYVFPDYAVTIGTLISILPLCSIPIGAILQIIRGSGPLLEARLERIRILLKPSAVWVPNERSMVEFYRMKPYMYEKSVLLRIKRNILGIGTPSESVVTKELESMTLKP